MSASTIDLKPVHLTHIAVSAIWALSLIATNAIIFYFSKKLDDIQFFYLFLINAAISTPNAYYLSKMSASPSAITETTTKS
jgi:hypothetical protein